MLQKSISSFDCGYPCIQYMGRKPFTARRLSVSPIALRPWLGLVRFRLEEDGQNSPHPQAPTIQA
ncbi:hypothetical protein ccbrp13_27050 [Ktedonobacteria bacterium brp13]|nr:hypothetical protein ccbrp13_27050 [Ktedonobacteria bacterium brp13]